MNGMRVVCVLAALLFSGIARAEELRVAAAISLKDALTTVIALYQKDHPETQVTPIYAASGALAAQIKAGAPVDVFISAAEKQVEDLKEARLIVAETKTVVARNTLVLVVPAGNPENLTSLDSLKSLTGKLAIGQPSVVPAGQYAAELLKFLKLDELLKPKLLFGANVRQVLAYVERGEVSAGLVYATDARTSGDKIKVIATAPAESHEPITYPAVVLSGSQHPENARRFLEFMTSTAGQAALKENGFSVP